MVECNSETVRQAADWLAALKPKSGTNTLDALLAAFDDDRCQAVYLVTDGYPDQDDQQILDHVAYAGRDRPVHCIYVCAEAIPEARALQFLEELAFETYGSIVVVSVSIHGSVERVSSLVSSTHPRGGVLRTADGEVYPDASHCSVTASLRGDPLCDPPFIDPLTGK